MMKMATVSAKAGEHGDSLALIKQRFAVWREGRKRGEHIPGLLWEAALGLVPQHGLLLTAHELRIELAILKKRFARITEQEQADGVRPQFVELFASPPLGAAPASGCVVEMENARGGKMRVELNNLDALAGSASTFWSAR